MRGKLLVSGFTAVLTLLAFGTSPCSSWASGTGSIEPDCEMVDFYVYNGINGVMYLDVTNWGTATRQIFNLDPGQEVRFQLEPGPLEWWAQDVETGLDDVVWIYVDRYDPDVCSDPPEIAGYLKPDTDGSPRIRLHVKLSEQ